MEKIIEKILELLGDDNPMTARQLLSKIEALSDNSCACLRIITHGPLGVPSVRSLGKNLKSLTGRVFGGRRLEMRRGAGGVNYYWASSVVPSENANVAACKLQETNFMNELSFDERIGVAALESVWCDV